MKNLRRANWVLAALTWALAALFGLSKLLMWKTELLAWTSVWIWSGTLWYFGAQASLLLSVCTLFSAIAADTPVERKACILCGLIVIAISVLVAIPALLVFDTGGGYGECFAYGNLGTIL